MTTATNTRVSAPAGMDAWFKPVVFYDGLCPMCRREIAHYRRMDRAQSLLWVDITREPERVQSYGLTVERAMQRFHVLDALGRWQTGVAAFLELWSHLPYYRWLASVVRALRLTGPLEILYQRWAGWRLRRRCGEDRCGLSRD
jgi:predicted DCC family thiol-disulfide oxidoreductase YuxK